MGKVAFVTLGCRLNQADSDAMADDLAANGMEVVAQEQHPDLVVVNTCTVTREATKASRTALRRAVRDHPDAKVVAIGCYAVSNPDEVEAIEGVSAALTNEDKDRVALTLATRPPTAPLLQLGMRAPASRPVQPAPPRVRANLKLQTGCDEWCSFCIIPTTRGPLRSYDADDVVAVAEQRVAAGARELVLTGVHLGKYAYDLGGDERDLIRLLQRLLAIDGVLRLRLSSILSRHLTEDVIRFIADEPRVCRYLHVPLQSGDDGVLDAMHRPYRIADYLGSVERAADLIPGLALATDVIVGFPGETDAQFEETLTIVERVGFSKLHVFRYSVRDGTAAAAMRGEVHPDVKKERSKRLIELGNRIRARFLDSHLLAPLEVLVEDRRVAEGATVCSGQTSDYVRVWFEGEAPLGDVVAVHGAEVRADGIRGELRS